MNRRTFLQAAAAAPLGRALFAAEPDIKFPTEPRARLGVASYPFRAFIDSGHNRDRDKTKPGMDLKQFPAMVREKFNVRNIEPLDSHFRSLEPAYLHELREAVEKAGMHIINIPLGVRASLYDPDPAKRAIVINLENDDPKTEDAFFLVKIIEQVNNPYLHGLPDFCNSMLKGDEKYNYDAVAAMFRHAYNISHVKDSEVDNGKVFRVDVGKTFAIAKQAGYRGNFSMEWEGEGGPYEGTQKLIDA